MPMLAVARVTREPLLPVRDGGGNGWVGRGVSAGVGVRNDPDIGTVLVGGGVARVLEGTGEVGPSIVEVREPQEDTRYTEGCSVRLAPKEC